MASLTQTVVRPYDRHDYNGIARVDTKAERGGVKLAFNDWIANTYIPAIANANPITSITNANPAVVTSEAHGFSNGNDIIIIGVVGMIELNEHQFVVANATANTFVLSGVDSTAYSAYESDGHVFLRPNGFSYSGLAYT